MSPKTTAKKLTEAKARHDKMEHELEEAQREADREEAEEKKCEEEAAKVKRKAEAEKRKKEAEEAVRKNAKRQLQQPVSPSPRQGQGPRCPRGCVLWQGVLIGMSGQILR